MPMNVTMDYVVILHYIIVIALSGLEPELIVPETIVLPLDEKAVGSPRIELGFMD